LKRLSFSFDQSTSILAHGDRLSQLFPSLTDLNLMRGVNALTNEHLKAIPSTVLRLQIGVKSQLLASEPITLTLLAKLSQNLELLHLKELEVILGPNESVEEFQFPDSLLDLHLTHLSVPDLLTKLPKFLQFLEVKLFRGVIVLPVSAFPPTLRTLNSHSVPLVVDGPFPPNLQNIFGEILWSTCPPGFVLPASLQRISCPLKLFGDIFEKIPQSLRVLDASTIELEPAHVNNFPPALNELRLGSFGLGVISMLPRTLTSLTLTAFQGRVLPYQVCERLENL
jgi:hypothetical protein